MTRESAAEFEPQQQWAISELLPHGGRMRLLTDLLDSDPEGVTALVCIQAQDLFFDPALGSAGGVGAWVGIEYMAQAVAAWAGLQARASGGAPKIGLLLGSRKYRCERACFELGDRLEVRVRREFQADNGLGQFACEILIGGHCVAGAVLTVFAPPDPEQFLREQGTSA
ncbi:ApeP family dehydratase [Roseateles oligotrophus]|uniref:ApeP family dehydratase n=1 Tax=Roseateles oligotrophus TaxID=1769250 RepID=UPI0037C9E37F